MTIQKPNYTQTPNVIFDEYMKGLSGSETKVIMCICRKTFGWQKEKDRISLSQIKEMSGLGRSTIIDAVKSLEDKKLIECKRRQNVPSEFNLVIETSTKTVPIEIEGVQKLDYRGPKVVPLKAKTSPESGHTKESNKETNKETKSLFTTVLDLIYKEYFSLYSTKLIIGNKERGQVKNIIKYANDSGNNPLTVIKDKVRILLDLHKNDKGTYWNFGLGDLLSKWNTIVEKEPENITYLMKQYGIPKK